MAEEAANRPRPRRPWGSGSEYTTGAGQHVAIDRLPSGKVVRGTSTRSMSEARARLRKKLRDGSSPDTTSPAGLETVAEYLSRWLDETAIHRLGPRTLALYRLLVQDWITPRLGSIALVDLHPDDVERLVNGILASGRSAQWAKHAHTVLRSALRDATKRGTVDRNVAALVDSVAVVRAPVVRLSAAEVRRFLAANRQHPHYAIWILAFTTGMRRGEILSLRWSDVDDKAGTVTIAGTLHPVKPSPRADGRRGRRTQWDFLEPKTPTSRRRLVLSRMAIAALAEHRKAFPPVRAPFLVFRRPDGKPIAPDWVTRSFHQALELASLPSIPFHATRHTAAAMMLDDSAGDLRLVSQALGHANIGTTVDRYGGIAARAMQRAADGMDRALGDDITADGSQSGR